MQCPSCGIETRISGVHTRVEGDSSPDTPTKVYTVQEIMCVNKQCERCGKVVETVEHLVYEGR